MQKTAPNGLSAKQRKALVALLAAPTIRQAAAAAGIAERTLYGWLEERAFDGAYRALLDQALDVARARMVQLSGQAVQALERNLTCGRPAIEVSAANALLDRALRFKEYDEFAARLARLEDAYAAKLP